MSVTTAIITVGSESGTCFALSSTILATAGHVAQAEGDHATVDVGGILLSGTVIYVDPLSPQGTKESASQVPHDLGLIRLDAPTTLLTPLHMAHSLIDGSTVTVDGYPSSTLFGFLTGTQVHTVITATAQVVTNFPGVAVDDHALVQGASGSPVLNAQGDVVGIVSGLSGSTQYITEMTPHVEMAIDATLLGINPVTTALLAELA
jgi:S1-C subfamily serine protease